LYSVSKLGKEGGGVREMGIIGEGGGRRRRRARKGKITVGFSRHFFFSFFFPLALSSVIVP